MSPSLPVLLYILVAVVAPFPRVTIYTPLFESFYALVIVGERYYVSMCWPTYGAEARLSSVFALIVKSVALLSRPKGGSAHLLSQS